MKKISDISDKNSSLDLKKNKVKDLSNDIDNLDDQLLNQLKR